MTTLALWESLRPNYAWAEQIPKDDTRLKTEYVTVPSPQGNGSIRGYLVRPAKAAAKLRSRPVTCRSARNNIRTPPGFAICLPTAYIADT